MESYVQRPGKVGLNATQLRDIVGLFGIPHPGKSMDDIILCITANRNSQQIIDVVRRTYEMLGSVPQKNHKDEDDDKDDDKDEDDDKDDDEADEEEEDCSLAAQNRVSMQRILSLYGLCITGSNERLLKRLLENVEM